MQVIGIVTAMKEEAQKIIQEYKLIREETLGGIEVYYIRLEANKKLYLFVSGIGKVNASKATTLAIVKYGVTSILNIGVVGAINPTYRIGDTFIVSQSKILDTYVPFEGYGYFTESHLCNIIGRLHNLTICGTSDKFIEDKTSIKAHCDIVDMELHSIASVCYDFNIPIYSIKSVSDGINDNGLDFEKSINLCIDNGLALLKTII